MKQYRLHSYSVAPRVGDQDGDDAHAHLDAMVRDGWTVHTANVVWPEASILWERDAPEDGNDSPGPSESSEVAEPKPKASTPARGRRSGAPSG